MKKIYTSDNYVILDIDGKIRTFSQTKSEYEEEVDHFTLRKYPSKDVIIFPFSEVGEWFDKLGTTPFTVISLKSFLRQNTGFKSGGSTGTVGGTFIEGSVNIFAELPNVSLNSGKRYEVLSGSQGFVVLGKRYMGKDPGVYISNGTNWVKLEVTDLDTTDINSDATNLSWTTKTTLSGQLTDLDTHLNNPSYTTFISNNAGQIKLNWTDVTRPSITGVVDAIPQPLPLNNNYTVSGFPTTTYPYLANELIGGENVIEPTTNYLRELKAGQVITFRIKVGYARKGANQVGAIILNISNPNPASSFNENLSIPALRGRQAYEQTVQISVIADGVSLDPLYGYEFSVVTEFDDANLNIYIQNVTAVYNSVDLFYK